MTRKIKGAARSLFLHYWGCWVLRVLCWAFCLGWVLLEGLEVLFLGKKLARLLLLMESNMGQELLCNRLGLNSCHLIKEMEQKQ